jgi:cytoskeletal protein RodZ
VSLALFALLCLQRSRRSNVPNDGVEAVATHTVEHPTERPDESDEKGRTTSTQVTSATAPRTERHEEDEEMPEPNAFLNMTTREYVNNTRGDLRGFFEGLLCINEELAKA